MPKKKKFEGGLSDAQKQYSRLLVLEMLVHALTEGSCGNSEIASYKDLHNFTQDAHLEAWMEKQRSAPVDTRGYVLGVAVQLDNSIYMFDAIMHYVTVIAAEARLASKNVKTILSTLIKESDFPTQTIRIKDKLGTEWQGFTSPRSPDLALVRRVEIKRKKNNDQNRHQPKQRRIMSAPYGDCEPAPEYPSVNPTRKINFRPGGGAGRDGSSAEGL